MHPMLSVGGEHGQHAPREDEEDLHALPMGGGGGLAPILIGAVFGIGALIIRIRFFFKGFYKGSIN